MKFLCIFFFLILTFNYSWSQHTDYFSKHKEYHYKAIYIDKHSDTITTETMVIKPLGRAWLPQPWLQRAVRYIYSTDSAGYKNYIDPEEFFHMKNVKYLSKKGKVRAKDHETTGGYYNDSIFYMHPPRVNQYRMLFYAPHPWVFLSKLTDSVAEYKTYMTIYGTGFFTLKYTVTPMPDIVIDSKKVRAWKMFIDSDGALREICKSEGIYNSTLDAVFTKEYGFIQLHYTFKNGIKIQFDFEKIVCI